jgi:hypothetical protein
MPDNLKKRGPKDATRINIGEPYELSYWSKKLNVPKEKIITAVNAVGMMARDVKKYIANRALAKPKKLTMKNLGLLSLDELAEMLANNGVFLNASIKSGSRFEMYGLNGSVVVIVGNSREPHLEGCTGISPRFLERMLKRKMGLPVW